MRKTSRSLQAWAFLTPSRNAMKKILFILGVLTDADIDWLLYVGRREELAAGTVLIQEGKPVDAVYIVLTGSLTVSIEALSGKEIAYLTSGEVVGEISFVDTRPPSATVTATQETLILSVPRQQLMNKLADDTGFASRFYRAIALSLSDRLRNTVSLLGYGKEIPSESIQLFEDLSPAVVEHLPLARSRFDSLLRRLRGY
ncbi:cyclic nucleotide-binding domain-containing protein [Phormidesmis priestleyi]